MNVSLSTNGTGASSEIAEEIRSAGLKEIQVSIHAPDETHDRIVGVQGAALRSFSGLRNLIEAGLGVTVAAVATRTNCSLLPELAQKIAKMGAKHFRVLRLMPHSHETLRQIVPRMEMQVLVKRLRQLEKELQEFTIEIHTSPGFLDTSASELREYSILHPLCHTCTAGKLSMAILSDGNCVPCLELKDPKFECGNVLRDPLAEIWRAKPMSLLRSVTPHRYHGKCGDCELKWTCYSARCVSYNLGGDLLGNDESCYRLLSNAD